MFTDKSELYQAGYNDYMQGECNMPEDSDYMDGWQNAQWDADSEFENDIFLKQELYENEHHYTEY